MYLSHINISLCVSLSVPLKSIFFKSLSKGCQKTFFQTKTYQNKHEKTTHIIGHPRKANPNKTLFRNDCDSFTEAGAGNR